jgi:hypothetical protein
MYTSWRQIKNFLDGTDGMGAMSTPGTATRHLQRYTERRFSSVQLARWHGLVRMARSVSRNVTSNRNRSVKTLAGTKQINSLASSGFTEQHAASSEPQRRAILPAVFQAAKPSVDFNYSRPAIAINCRPVTSKAPPEAPQNVSCVFTECVNKSAYHLQPNINCGDTPPPTVSS